MSKFDIVPFLTVRRPTVFIVMFLVATIGIASCAERPTNSHDTALRSVPNISIVGRIMNQDDMTIRWDGTGFRNIDNRPVSDGRISRYCNISPGRGKAINLITPRDMNLADLLQIVRHIEEIARDDGKENNTVVDVNVIVTDFVHLER